MAGTQEDQFSSLLEKYSEFLTDASNREDLLTLGRRLFSAGPGADTRASLELLRAKEEELLPKRDGRDSKPKGTRTFLTNRTRPEPPSQGLTQEQITAEIVSLQQKNQELHEQRSEREAERTKLLEEYEVMIHDSVREKAELKTEIRRLTLELSESLLRSRVDVGNVRTRSAVAPVIRELSELNDQILHKIGGFKESTRDALAHCERAALDRYKPKMEELLDRIYNNASELPIEEIRDRFEEVTNEVETQIEELRVEMNSENIRNDRLQTDTHQMEDRVGTQRDDLSRMKKEYGQLGHEITLLSDVAVQEIGSLKMQYQRLIKDDEGDRNVMASGRAVVLSTVRDSKRLLHRIPSQPLPPIRELRNPTVRTVEEFVEQEKQRLLGKIRHSKGE
jgi:hypothetical protein